MGECVVRDKLQGGARTARGGELMAVVQTAMLNGVPFPSFRDTIFTHPTMAEGLTSLLADIEVRPKA